LFEENLPHEIFMFEEYDEAIKKIVAVIGKIDMYYADITQDNIKKDLKLKTKFSEAYDIAGDIVIKIVKKDRDGLTAKGKILYPIIRNIAKKIKEISIVTLAVITINQSNRIIENTQLIKIEKYQLKN
jgi:hypothetical protein